MSPLRSHDAMTDDAPPKMPRWVKTTLWIGGAILALAIGVALLAPGGHGPRLHG